MATLKKLMTLLSKEGLLDQREDVIKLWTAGRTSSAKDLTPEELTSICKTIQENSIHIMDKKRKRVIAAIFGMFTKMNKVVTVDYVKGLACRAAKVNDFNVIPSARLDSLYNAFIHAQKDLTISNRIVEGYISEQQHYN